MVIVQAPVRYQENPSLVSQMDTSLLLVVQGLGEQDRVTTLPRDQKAIQNRTLKDDTLRCRSIHKPGVRAQEAHWGRSLTEGGEETRPGGSGHAMREALIVKGP